MANGHPKFGGSNGVPALDIGQIGGTRYAAGDARSTVRVIRNPEIARRSEHVYAQENLMHVDVLGFAGGIIEWQISLYAKTMTIYRAICSELDSYSTGSTRNATTGLLNDAVPGRVAPTQLTDVDGGLMGARVVLDNWGARSRRTTNQDGWIGQQLTIRFKQVG